MEDDLSEKFTFSISGDLLDRFKKVFREDYHNNKTVVARAIFEVGLIAHETDMYGEGSVCILSDGDISIHV
jgi:hypothetical protein